MRRATVGWLQTGDEIFMEVLDECERPRRIALTLAFKRPNDSVLEPIDRTPFDFANKIYVNNDHPIDRVATGWLLTPFWNREED